MCYMIIDVTLMIELKQQINKQKKKMDECFFFFFLLGREERIIKRNLYR